MRKYDVYGFVRSGDAGTSDHKFVGALGHPSDSAAGLIYMRARYMDPATGRFLRRDPARQGTNWYTYCLANPANLVDTTGRFAGFDDYLNEEAEDAQASIQAKNWFTNKINQIFDVVRRDTGMSRQQFGDVIHQIKHEMQIGANEDLWMNKQTGHLFRMTGEGMEDLGHVLDWI